MTRFATTATVAAFVALSAVAANAADLRGAATHNTADNGAQVALRAGNVYTPGELLVLGMNASDTIAQEQRGQVQVRAGDVYSARDLRIVGLNADDVLAVNDFSNNGRVDEYDNRR